jgi:VanZ family protein
VEFGVLSLLAYKALKLQLANVHAAMAGGALLALAYAVSDEYHQSFVAGRYGTPRDVVFDLAGILIAMSAVYLASRRADRLRTAG